MTKHTPGPWKVLDNRLDGGGNTLLVHSQNVRDGAYDVAEVYGEEVGKDEEALPDCFGVANARLIASAPDLLAACEEALSYIGTCSKGATQDQLRAAIKKATAS